MELQQTGKLGGSEDPGFQDIDTHKVGQVFLIIKYLV